MSKSRPSLFRKLQSLWICHFSQPAAYRPVYRTVLRHRPQRITEVGIFNPECSLRLIRLSSQVASRQPVQYTLIDPFESRSDGPTVSLREAHRFLRTEGVQTRLLPGELTDGITNWANQLLRQQLVIISYKVDESQWFNLAPYLERMLDENAHLIVQHHRDQQICYKLADVAALRRLAEQYWLKRRAA